MLIIGPEGSVLANKQNIKMSKNFDSTNATVSQMLFQAYSHLQNLQACVLFSLVFCITTTSTPVEHVLLQSGLVLRPCEAQMSDALLEIVVWL